MLLPDRWAEFDLHFHSLPGAGWGRWLECSHHEKKQVCRYSGQLTDHLPEGWTQPDCARSEAAPLHIVSVRLGWKEIRWSLGWRLTAA